MLCAIPKFEEIFKVVCFFEGDKSLGPNGFPMIFFQKEWKLLRQDVYDVVKEFFGAKRMLKEVNFAFLCLILKKIGVDSLD